MVLAELQFAEVASLLPIITQLRDGALFEKLTVSLDFTNDDRTSNVTVRRALKIPHKFVAFCAEA